MKFVLHGPRSRPSGRLIADALGAQLFFENDNQLPTGNIPELVVRWGSTRTLPWPFSRIRTVNTAEGIAKACDKFASLKAFADAGLRVPFYSLENTEHTVPFLGRKFRHRGGRDIHLHLQSVDKVQPSSDYYIEYIPKRREFRVHVVDGRVISVREKIFSTELGKRYNPVVWSYNRGFRFTVSPRDNRPSLKDAAKAVKALDLDFGAVDCLLGEDDNIYWLEVNTAPGITESTAAKYATAIENMSLLTEELHPAFDSVME